MADDEDARARHLFATLDRLLGDGPAEPSNPTLEAARPGGESVLAGVEGRWGQRTLLGNLDGSLVALRPRWGTGHIPQLSIEPATTQGAPRREGDFLIWSDLDRGRIYFALAVPRLLDVAVLIRREDVGGTIKITGGSVTLSVSAYSRVGPRVAQTLEDQWDKALRRPSPRIKGPGRSGEGLSDGAVRGPLVRLATANGSNGAGAPSLLVRRPGDETVTDPPPPKNVLRLSYLPLALNRLDAALDMDPALLAGPPTIATSPDVGTVTFVIPLSELGAQAWMNALEGPGGQAIGGVCRIQARAYAHQGGPHLRILPIELVAPLGDLLAGRGREIMQVLNGPISAEGRVVVSGHQTLEMVTVSWRPSEGHRPEALIFGPEGGSFTAAIVSPHIDQVTIDWAAEVVYQPTSWPVIKRSGQLSFARNDSILLLKPESWITTYSIFVVLLDQSGDPVEHPEHAADTNNRVQCQVSFTAPFLAGGRAITETFETSSQTLTDVAFPLPPGEVPGAVTLTVFAQLGAAAPIMKARVIQAWETFLMVKVTLAGAVEIVTNAPEGGALGNAFMDLASLRR